MKQTIQLATSRRAASVLNQVEFLQGLDRDVLYALTGELQLTATPRGGTVYRQGDPADGLHILIDGKVKICRRAADGREQLLEIRGPGDVLGAVSVLDPGRRTATAMAVTVVCTAFLDRATLETWMVERPQIAQRLLRLMAGRLRAANSHLLDVVFDDVPARVARELLRLARRFGSREGQHWSVKHDLTQGEIAQLVGATRESVNKALCDFVQRGWITNQGKVTLIHSPEHLAKRAGVVFRMQAMESGADGQVSASPDYQAAQRFSRVEPQPHVR